MHKQPPLLYLIIITYLALGFFYAWKTPAWQSPDEPAHYNFVRFIAQNWNLPELTADCYDQAYLDRLRGEKFPPHLSVDSVCYEHYQPPLFYLLATPTFVLSEGNLVALRMFSLFLGAVSLFFIHQTIDLFMAGTIFPLATTAFAAFVPMHLTMLASVNNDSLAELLLAVLIYLMLRWLFGKAKQGGPAPLIAGVILGLILLTKATVYSGIIVVAFILLLAKRRLATFAMNALRVYLPGLLLGLLLYTRNALVYGNLDILGLARHDIVVVGQPRTIDRIINSGLYSYFNELVRTTFHSFWGQFGWMAVPMDRRVYLILFLALLAAMLGLLFWFPTHFPRQKETRQGLAVMGLTLLLTLGIFVALNLSFVQFQGRYFFTALMPLGLFFSIGLFEASRREHAMWVSLLMALVLIVVFFTSLQAGNLDKWGILISGSAAGLFFIRRWLPEQAATWFIAAFYVALGVLAGLSIWWFILPNL